VQQHDERWVEYFRRRGAVDVRPLAAGMEGAVYHLGDGTVAKVWAAAKPATELQVVHHFFADLAKQSLPFATPEILDVTTVDGTLVTVERELLGIALQDVLGDGCPPATIEDDLTIVLEALAAVGPLDSARELRALGEERAWRGDDTWPVALAALVERRLARFGGVLTGAVPDLEGVRADLLAAIAAMEGGRDAVIHGDICGVNILVDDELRPTALLDWSFLSTAGDPAFDAAVTAAIFDMYGAGADAIDGHLREVFARRLGHDPDHLLVHRAAYAAITSNAYDPEGRDGHFAWCARTLQRADVRVALARVAARA
jgi:aminoglycoside phosphotransferase (APT) family kinase protein